MNWNTNGNGNRNTSFPGAVPQDLPDVRTVAERRDEDTTEPEEMIEGILRKGRKMLVAGPSKAGKTYLLLELCIAFAEGLEWLGCRCRKCRALYVNLELPPETCLQRIRSICRKRDVDPDQLYDLGTWDLRGKAMPLDLLLPGLIERVRKGNYEVVVLDPLYKILTGDENSATDMAYFFNRLDELCQQTGATAICCHHHSKGFQGYKRSADRASGSGVFARDPDAVLDLIELEIPRDRRALMEDMTVTLWRMEGALREYASFPAVNIWFRYPLHVRDDSENLVKAPAKGSRAVNLQKSSRRTSRSDRWRELTEAYDRCAGEDGVRAEVLAEEMHRDEKTVRRRVKEFCTEFVCRNSVICRKPPAEEGEGFVKPTLNEIREYCREIGSGVDPDVFRDYYESQGWMVGQNPMKDWKASVRAWENRGGI